MAQVVSTGVELKDGYSYSSFNINAGGAFDYLPDGDILAIDLSYSSLNKLYRFDANGDGAPASPVTLAEFGSGIYGSIVKISPDKTFAIVGTSGASNMLYRLDLSTNALSTYELENLVEVQGNYDLLFLDNDTVLVSANSGGFDMTKPNELSVIDLANPDNARVVARVDGTPSGAIALGANGDVFYIKNTWSYPAPSGSFKLYRFDAKDIQQVVSNGGVLLESDAHLITSLDGGADIAVDVSENDALYVSLYSGEIIKIDSVTGVSEVFCSVSGGSFVQLSFLNNNVGFLPYVYFDNALGVSLATNFFSTHEVLEITTDTKQGSIDAFGLCVPGTKDCVNEPLEPRACVGANGFLGQINIASVVNLLDIKLPIVVEYYDLTGKKVSAVTSSVKPKAKSDFIINDMGLAANTYGTVCVTADAPPHSWTGGIALYKPDTRVSSGVFGDAFDFALYYPFENPKYGRTTVPLNTYHVGMDTKDTVANWIAISDAKVDGLPVRGKLIYYAATGEEVGRDVVYVPDGGRRDFAGHQGVTGGKNIDAVGMAEFVPSEETSLEYLPYYLNVTRYFYDCGGFACDNFLSAFVIPNRPGTSGVIGGSVTAQDGVFSVVELNNTSASSNSVVALQVRSDDGGSVGSQSIKIPTRATRHVIMNKSGDSGFIEPNETGTALTQSVSGSASAITFVYELGKDGKLVQAYAAPLVGAARRSQVSQFNSYIKHANILEINNLGSYGATVFIKFVDVYGAIVYENSVNVGSYASVRLDNLSIPSDTFGAILLESDVDTIVMRNSVGRVGEYTLAFTGQ